ATRLIVRAARATRLRRFIAWAVRRRVARGSTIAPHRATRVPRHARSPPPAPARAGRVAASQDGVDVQMDAPAGGRPGGARDVEADQAVEQAEADTRADE